MLGRGGRHLVEYGLLAPLSPLLDRERGPDYKNSMKDILIQPLLAGLSTGLFCCAFCWPFVAPVLVAEERTWRETWRVLGWLILGRFFGYALFGFLVGALSEQIENATWDAVLRIALLTLSVALALYGLGLLKPQVSWCAAITKHQRWTPFVLGLLMGINLCPPFLLSVLYVFTLHSAIKGLIYFVMFFLATTVYFLPLGALGGLARWPDLRWAARISAILVGLIFGGYAAYSLIWDVDAIHRP